MYVPVLYIIGLPHYLLVQIDHRSPFVVIFLDIILLTRFRLLFLFIYFYMFSISIFFYYHESVFVILFV